MATSAVLAGLGIAAGAPPEVAAASFLAGVFIDVDHWIDYWLMRRLDLDVQAFFAYFRRPNQSRIFIPLHGYELLALWWTIALAGGLGPWAIGVAAGCSLHLALDQLTNPVHPLGYFLAYRVAVRFEGARLVGQEGPLGRRIADGFPPPLRARLVPVRRQPPDQVGPRR